jgi:hypothetical protein
LFVRHHSVRVSKVMMMLWGYSDWGVHCDGKDVIFRLRAVYTIQLTNRESRNRKQ